jgi:hypothetical protein
MTPRCRRSTRVSKKVMGSTPIIDSATESEGEDRETKDLDAPATKSEIGVPDDIMIDLTIDPEDVESDQFQILSRIGLDSRYLHHLIPWLRSHCAHILFLNQRGPSHTLFLG